MKGKKDKELQSQATTGGALNTSTATGSKDAAAGGSGGTPLSELSFPDVTPMDHVKCCPRFTSILNRPAGDGVGIEEMDSLQMEMESLLVHAMQRTRLLKLETMILDNANTDKATAELMRLNSPSVPMPRTPTAELKHSSLLKREKSFQSKPAAATTTPSKLSALNETSAPIVRNDIPDTFWQSVEPYCADITDEDIKYLEGQIEFYEKSIASTLQLGKHFSMQWAEEDIGQQIKEGARFLDLDSTPTSNKRKYSQLNDSANGGGGGGNLNGKQALVSHLMDESMQKFNVNGSGRKKAAHGATDGDRKYYGPLTQRLISALIEQNLITPFEGEISDFVDTIGCSSPSKASARALGNRKPNSTSSPIKAGGYGVANTLEKRLKRSLFESGLFDSLEDTKPRLNGESDNDLGAGHNGHNGGPLSKEDEIANEIKLLNNEIKMVGEQCKRTLSQLLDSANKAVAKQSIRKKINTVDAEINEIYQKFKALRQAKKPATKKDRDKALKLIKEREQLRSQLQHSSCPCPPNGGLSLTTTGH